MKKLSVVTINLTFKNHSATVVDDGLRYRDRVNIHKEQPKVTSSQWDQRELVLEGS